MVLRFLLFLLLSLCLASTEASAHGLGFFNSPEQAVEYARENKGLLLVFFTGSDWCQLSHELDVKVWEDSDFAEYANSSAFALLNADYPQRTRLDAARRKELRALAERHRITHFPTLLALTPGLVELGRHEYHGETAADIMPLLEDWQKKHASAPQQDALPASRTTAPADEPSPPLADLKVGDALPALTFTGSDGKPLPLASMRGNAVLLTFIFTRCPLPEYCPLLAQKFKTVQAQMKALKPMPENWRLLSLTIDPKNDTPGVLAKYGSLHGADPAHWKLATGELATISQLALALGADFWADKDGFITHHLHTVLIAPDGRITAIHTDNDWSAEGMAAQMTKLARSARP